MLELKYIAAVTQLYVITIAAVLTIHSNCSPLQSPRSWKDDFVSGVAQYSSPIPMGANYWDIMEMGINSSTSLDQRYNSTTSVESSQHFNAIDNCWRRRNPRWAENRMALADCAIGYGAYAQGGKGGKIYTVVSSEDDAVNPKPGTLRYGVALPGRVWIVFGRNMNIVLKMPLVVGSYKTIDGRGAQVHISGGACILIHEVQNVIIHGLNIHLCKPTDPGYVMWSDSTIRHLGRAEGDGISIRSSRHVWIDHNTLSICHDGLIDVTLESTYVTLSNNWLKHHHTVMLLGHSDHFSEDKLMRVTVAYNQFGPGCGQRMPR
ncbi:hypothetical protein SUGI_0914290 [Cryptomeria japonica]|nr:hypothetical protein SUGI_0914290 [Cryptomeria japonica]